MLEIAGVVAVCAVLYWFREPIMNWFKGGSN